MTIRKAWTNRGLIEMSWTPQNLFSLALNARTAPEKELNKTTFQMRWRAKQQSIPYHAGHLTQHQFVRSRQRILPSVSRRSSISNNNINGDSGSNGSGGELSLPFPPATMLTFAFMERRVDVALFRSCLVTSIWHARQLVRRGHICVNGRRVGMPGFVLEDGDIVQVKPDYVTLLTGRVPHAPRDQDTDDQKVSLSEKDQTSEENSDSENNEVLLHKRDKRYMYPTAEHPLHPQPYMSPWLFTPAYIEVNYRNLSFCFLRAPSVGAGMCELPSPFDEVVHQRTHDFYSSYRQL